ncbi:hypothetical protein EV421DRAFT_1861078 [Armillaria borealis]|uniref:Uncharacterized protein n=1 Tax=Armillaria borealis TaxID=47425 RepID=A0AA39MDS9_9AGAR|nr:hypothetical protein EV421DRAFT_1861078 [Armillaria borealis]
MQKPTGIDEEPPNINEPPSQRHIDYRKVFSNRGLVGAHNFLFVQPNDIPRLPFHCQLLLHVAPHYRYEEPNALIGQIEAYLAEDPKREPTTTACPNDYDGVRYSGQGADCHSRLSLRCVDRLIRRPRSESRRAVDVPRHAARTRYSHAHPLDPCMVVSTDLGLSRIPRILTHG